MISASVKTPSASHISFHVRVSILTLSILNLVPVFAEDASTSEHLIGVLVAEQDRSLSKIQSLAVRREFEYFRTGPRGVDRQEGTLFHIFDGQKSVAIVDRVFVGEPTTAGDGSRPHAGREWLIVGDSYVFLFTSGTGSANMTEFTPSKHKPKDLQNLVNSYLFAAPLRYGYGVDDVTLKEVASPRFQIRHRVEASQIDDLEKYVIRVFHRPEYVANAPHPVWELTVDSIEGYQITEGIMRDPDGSVYRHIKTRSAEVQPGVWFAVELEDIFYGEVDQAGGQQEIHERKLCRATEVKINPVLPDDTFTWQSLNLPDGTRIMRTDVLGKSEPMLVQNNDLIPASLVRKIGVTDGGVKSH